MEYKQEPVISEKAEQNNELFGEFRDMDYYMLLESGVGYGIYLEYNQYGIYGNLTKTAREGEELYFKLNEKILGNCNAPNGHMEWMQSKVDEHIRRFSSDMRWCVTNQYPYENGYDKIERLYENGLFVSETRNDSYMNILIEKFTICRDRKTGEFQTIDEDRRQRMEALINELWNPDNSSVFNRYRATRTCLSDDGMLLAEVKRDNRHIGIYETDSATELFEFDFSQLDEDWPLEISQLCGDNDSGWMIFSNGEKTYQYYYPENVIVELGEFMFGTSISPDGKYCAYYTGSSLLYDKWEDMYLDKNDKYEEMREKWDAIPSGWYIKELETGKMVYIPIEKWELDSQPLYCGVCTWLEKDKLLEFVQEAALSEAYCSIDEFEELDYYLFCDSQLHEGAGGFTFKPCIIGGETETIEEAKQLYHKFIEKLPLDSVEEGEENNAFYVSPDCEWVIMNKWSEHKKISTQMLFYKKEKIREKVTEARNVIYPIMIVKDGDNYREISEKCYEKLIEKQKIFFDDGGYDCFRGINMEGNLFAEIQDDYNLLTIREIENWTEQWSFSLQGILQEEVAQIRDDIEEGDTIWVSIQQFEGNEKEGWVTVQADQSSFFRIAYPSGEVTYLGEYMYSACFSPDGKYIAYSSDVDYDNGVGMEPEEYERMERICPPGICIREIETGKTAYIYWDPAKNPEENYMEYRHFMWIEKEGFEEYMGGS